MKKPCLIFLALFAYASLIYGQTSESNKRNAKLAYNNAVGSILSSNFHEALNYLESGLKLDSSDIKLKLALVKVKIELNENESVLSDLKSFMRDHPSNGEFRFYMGYLLFNGKADSLVLDYLNNAVSLGYEESHALYYRGLVKYFFEDYQGAIADYTKAIDKNKSYSLAYHDRGTARRALGDMQGALYDYRMATDFDHNFPVAFNNMGSVKTILGDYEGALQDYTVAIKLDNNFAIAFNNRGKARFYLGYLDEALADFEQAILIEESYIPAINNKASSLAKKGTYSEAIDLFNTIIEEESQHAIAYLNRGLVRELTGDLNGACADWNKALDLGFEEAGKYLTECK